MASIDVVGALTLGDDMGFKTQTLLSPAVYREYLFPWYRKLVETVHSHGKPIILHACGNLSEVMEDIIGCGWDARHSFEDVIAYFTIHEGVHVGAMLTLRRIVGGKANG